MEDNKCPVCGFNIKRYEKSNRGFYEYYIECPRCGIFCFSDKYFEKDKVLNINARVCIYYILTHNVFGHKKINPNDIIQPKILVFMSGISQDGYEGIYYKISEKTLYSYLPKDFLDRVDKVLINLGEYIGEIGNSITIDKEKTNDIFHAICFVSNHINNPSGYISHLFALIAEIGYIVKPHDNLGKYNISAKGWAHLEELKKSNKAENQVFIAIWFDERMNKARDVIKSAIQECGYIPIIIDEKEHNNQIVPEVLYEITKSKFVVADLTGHRGGVYYEAGYSTALEKPLILTCSKNECNNIHFDVQQISTIFWDDEEDLKDRLIKRINATVGQNN